jgi:type II secretory pathway component GspD/PulD (secretin)
MEKGIKHHRPDLWNRLVPVAIILVLACVQLLIASVTNADASNSKIRINYSDNRIDISVQNAELKTVLSKLSEAADIPIYFHSPLKKKVSINKKNISLRQTLKSLLKKFNYIILYSGPSKANASVDKVLVYSKTEKSRKLTVGQRRTASRIERYGKQLERLNQQLSKAAPNSSRAKRYQQRIKSLEKRIDKLRRE